MERSGTGSAEARESERRCSSSSSGNAFSLSHLTQVNDNVLVLRQLLRDALLHEGIQKEMKVYRALRDLYNAYYVHLSYEAVTGAPTDRPAVAEQSFVVAAFTQDVFAACLFLMAADETTFELSVPLCIPPRFDDVVDGANDSDAYVSRAQRCLCCRILLFLCFSGSIAVAEVLQSLYPLLDAVPPPPPPHAASPNGAKHRHSAETAQQNNIAPNLFQHERFRARKRVIAAVLNGLVLSSPHGMQALVSVLLLNDRIATEAVREAAERLCQVLISPMSAVWMVHRETADAVVVFQASVSVEEQVKRIAAQLVPLMEAHAERTTDTVVATRTSPTPLFLQQLKSSTPLLPQETLEQRLHVALTIYANAMVRLPPRSSPLFPQCYRQLYYFNQYALTPAFQCLSLRNSGTAAADEISAALRRLLTLARGGCHGAATTALMEVLPVVSPGLLNLSELRTTTSEGSARAAPLDLLEQLWGAVLSLDSCHEYIARSLVAGCRVVTCATFVVESGVEPRLYCQSGGCSPQRRIVGLHQLLSERASAVPEFVKMCVDALAEESQLMLYGCGVDSLTGTASSSPFRPAKTAASTCLSGVEEAEAEEDDVSQLLVRLLETIVLELPAECIFGTSEVTLCNSLYRLRQLLPLSAVTCQWSIRLMTALLAPESLLQHLCVSSTDDRDDTDTVIAKTATQKQRQPHRLLLQECQSIAKLLTFLRSLDPTDHTSFVASDLLLNVIALESLLHRSVEQVHQYMESEKLKDNGQEDVEASDATNAAAIVNALWQDATRHLHSAMDRNASVDLSIALTKLATSVDTAIIEIRDSASLSSTVAILLPALVRVLYITDDMGAAARAIHSIAWLSMYRFDSTNSSEIGAILFAALSSTTPGAPVAAWIGYSKGPAAVARIGRFKVRLLDVLLSLVDYDEDARTLRNIDDAFHRTGSTSLYGVLSRLCQATEEAVVQVSALHLIGHYAVAVWPRVELNDICRLCQDVFRHTPFEMAKASCASMLAVVVAWAVECNANSSTPDYFAAVDLKQASAIAAAMASYRGRPLSNRGTVSEAEAALDLHDAVIQRHGHQMLDQLRQITLNATD